MVLDIYKGFSIEFYKNINYASLSNRSIEDRLNINKYDRDFYNRLQIATISNEGHYWITYEEYTYISKFLEAKAQCGEITLNVYKNNKYPEIYPIPIKIDDNIIDKIDREEEEIYTKIYSNIYKMDNEVYVSYYNNESGISVFNEVKGYYDVEDELDASNDVDYFFSISNDIVDFINRVNDIEKNEYKRIGLICMYNTNISNMVRDAYKVYFKDSDVKLYTYLESIDGKDKVISEFYDIAKNIIKIPNFKDFRELDFYENIDISKKIVKVKQDAIMYDIVNEAMNAASGTLYRDIFVTAPTGSGKSVMFQIPAIYLANKNESLTIVIEPIKGLMEDQKEKLNNLGYKKVAFLNSDIATNEEKEKIIEMVKNKEVNLLYLSPETLLSYSIESLIGNRSIGLVIVDEAHIVTTWGAGFRPDYWYLGSYLNKIRNNNSSRLRFNKDAAMQNFPICTFTATAICGGEDDTFVETAISLYMKSPIKYIGVLRRNNIKFEIKCNNEVLGKSEYETKKIDILGKRVYDLSEKGTKTIMYFPYHSLAQGLYDGLGLFKDLDVFKDSFGLYTGQTLSNIKEESLNRFKSGDAPIMLATKAFGMGIDIDDVEVVYHYAATGNLSDYVQEIGRVARKSGIVGTAIMDYFQNDKLYMKRLFGMSQIRHYQINKVLEILYDVYSSKKERNFLVTPRMFFGIFGKDEDSSTNKLKIALLMLEKDMYDKYSFNVLISRPRSIFTASYVVVDRMNEDAVFDSRYDKYFTFNSNGKVNYPNPDGSFTTDFGDVYRLDLKSLWEDLYPNMTFAAFKHDFYSKTGAVCSEIKEFIRNRVKVEIDTKNGLSFSNLREKVYEDVNFITDKLSEFGRSYFTVDDFAKKLEEKYGVSLKQKLIANSFLEIIDENREVYKERTDDRGVVNYTISNSSITTKALHLVRNCSLLRELSNKEESHYECFLASDKNESNLRAFRLLSLLDLITYEVIGGDNPEIFIRLNDPEKIRKIVNKQIYYTNSYVDKARCKHERDVKILDYFFRNLKTDEERWQYIEDYFTGEDVIKDVYDVPDEINFSSLESAVVKDRSLTLKKVLFWKEVYRYVDDDYLPVVNKLCTLNIPLPNYASAEVKIDLYKFNALIVWTNKNVVIIDDEENDNIISICKMAGIKAYKASSIDFKMLKNDLK